MSMISKIFRNFFLVCLTFFAISYAFADEAVLAPQDFLSQVLQTIHDLGGLSWVLKISAIVTLVISSMKVSFLNQLVWSKIGSLQAWLAPILGLAAGILSLASSEGGISLKGVFAYLGAGAGALILHELLDTVKVIPGLGGVYVQIITTIEGFLGGPAAQKS